MNIPGLRVLRCGPGHSALPTTTKKKDNPWKSHHYDVMLGKAERVVSILGSPRVVFEISWSKNLSMSTNWATSFFWNPCDSSKLQKLSSWVKDLYLLGVKVVTWPFLRTAVRRWVNAYSSHSVRDAQRRGLIHGGYQLQTYLSIQAIHIIGCWFISQFLK